MIVSFLSLIYLKDAFMHNKLLFQSSLISCRQELYKKIELVFGSRKYFHVMGHVLSVYCVYKLSMAAINILFDRVGKTDPVTRVSEVCIVMYCIECIALFVC